MKAKCIFFDLDNTIWDFNASADLALTAIYEQYLRSLGVVDTEWRKVYATHNEELWNDYRLGLVGSSDVKSQRFFRAFSQLRVDHLPYLDIASEFLDSIVNNTVLFPRVVETLHYLAKHYTLGVITNGFAASAERLTRLKLDKLFSALITSEYVGIPKPRPEIFHYALKVVNSKPEDVVYIGDDYDTDILGAKGAGLRAILFNHKRECLDRRVLAPDEVIYEFSELMHLFPPKTVS